MADQKMAQDFKGDVTKLSFKLKIFVAAMSMLERLAPSATAHLMLDKFLTPRRKKDSNYLTHLPAGAQRITVYHNLTKLTGWVWGDKGPAVLLLHGWEGSTGRMIPMIEPLLHQGYRVFTLDAPGHGLSPKARTHLLDVGNAIQAMMEQHGPFYGVIAHSFGAAATSIMLAREPQLMPEKLILLSPMRDLDQHFEIFSSIARLSPAGRERVRQLIVRRVGQPFEKVSAIAAVRQLKSPGLIIHDRHDALIPYAVGEAVAQNWHNAQFISTDKLGHRAGLRNTTVIHHVLAFLTRHTMIAPSAFTETTIDFGQSEYHIRKTS